MQSLVRLPAPHNNVHLPLALWRALSSPRVDSIQSVTPFWSSASSIPEWQLNHTTRSRCKSKSAETWYDGACHLFYLIGACRQFARQSLR